MRDIFKKISLIGIVPVIKIDDAEKAVPLAKAIYDGGIRVAEITFRTEQAGEAIKRISSSLPDMLVGAGTVLTTDQVDRAVSAGARFILSPGFNPKVVEYCITKNIAIIPGCSNSSDIEKAVEFGLEVVKFFPAEASGGIKMIRALSGPFGNVKFMPTGGIDNANLNDYLSFPKVLACGGSWMVPENLIKEGNFEEITKLSREAVGNMLGFKLAHVGLSCEDGKQFIDVAKEFSDLFDFELNIGKSAIFADTAIEIMKEPYIGKNGHIAIKTNYIDRAVNYLTSKGYSFDQATVKYDEVGKLKVIYLRKEIAGFGIHLVQ